MMELRDWQRRRQRALMLVSPPSVLLWQPRVTQQLTKQDTTLVVNIRVNKSIAANTNTPLVQAVRNIAR